MIAVRASRACIAALLWLVACSGSGGPDGPSSPPVPGTPVALRVRGAVAAARVGIPAPLLNSVDVVDAAGLTVPTANAIIRVRLSGGGSLTGDSVAPTVAGAAAFSTLGLRGAVGERTLVFESPGLTSVTVRVLLQPAPRSRDDRPDEQSGPQVHAMYVSALDGVDRGLDTTTTLAYSIASFQNWFASQTGGRGFNTDTWNGAVDITYFRLTIREAELTARGAFVVTEIERQLGEAGLLDTNKLYIVYYDGTSTVSCGAAAWPPHVPGRVAAMFLNGLPTGARCASQQFVSSPTQFPGYWEFAMLHDLVHTTGNVSADAPNHTAATPAHVPEPTDLMYTGPTPWQIGVNMALDLGRNDYFGAGLAAGLPNLATSRYLVPVPVVMRLERVVAPLGAGVSVRVMPGVGGGAAVGALPPHAAFPGGKE
jgi:hypothetical protein